MTIASLFWLCKGEWRSVNPEKSITAADCSNDWWWADPSSQSPGPCKLSWAVVHWSAPGMGMLLSSKGESPHAVSLPFAAWIHQGLAVIMHSKWMLFLLVSLGRVCWCGWAQGLAVHVWGGTHWCCCGYQTCTGSCLSPSERCRAFPSLGTAG